MKRGIAVAVLQCLMVLSLAGKYTLDRQRLPRAWVRSLPFDPSLPIRGRYVSLRLEVMTEGVPKPWGPVSLSAENGRLMASPAETGPMLMAAGNNRWTLAQPVTYFIPDNVPDPSRRAAGEELWVEVSVPKKGPPRPVSLGVRKDGVLTRLPL